MPTERCRHEVGLLHRIGESEHTIEVSQASFVGRPKHL